MTLARAFERIGEDVVGACATVAGHDHRLESWQRGERLPLIRNDGSWGAHPPMRRVEWRVVPGDSDRALMLLSDEAM